MKPLARKCVYCGRTKGVFAFVNPKTKKAEYAHPKCFTLNKEKV